MTCSSASRDMPTEHCRNHGDAISRIRLSEQTLVVTLNRPLGQVQRFGDLGGIQALEKQQKYFALAACQREPAGRVRELISIAEGLDGQDKEGAEDRRYALGGA